MSQDRRMDCANTVLVSFEFRIGGIACFLTPTRMRPGHNKTVRSMRLPPAVSDAV
jgi:hypothetical protein